ncbi:MAG: aryl-sulfate sulfotransferase [Bacteroidia bacterium]
MKKQIAPLLFLLCLALSTSAQITMGLLQADSTNVDGYVLFSPLTYNETYLIDKCGRKINEWPATYRPGNSVYLLEDGTLLRTGNLMNPAFSAGGSGGYIEKVSWTGQIVWSYEVSDANRLQHHDVYPMPNGNVLVLLFEKKTLLEAFDAGLDTIFSGTEFFTEKIIELQPLGTDSATIIWEWSVWDHLIQQHNSSKSNFGVVQSHPELVHINFNITATSTNPDWIHLNAVTYNPALNQIILCSRFFSEFWIIDHSTTTTSASGHVGGKYGKGGDILYRWGNPRTYNRGIVSDQKLYGPHSAHWILDSLNDGGAVMVFNNGTGRPGGNYSTVEVIHLPQDSAGYYTQDTANAFGPLQANWTYTDPVPTSFFSMNISNAQRLPNGHTLICEGSSGTFFEIDSIGNTVWQYKNPVNQNGPATQGNNIFINQVFRSLFYAPDYPAFQLYPPTAGSPIEFNPQPSPCTMNTGIENLSVSSLHLYPNPSTGAINIHGNGLRHTGRITIFNSEGKMFYNYEIESNHQPISINTSLPNGFYCLHYFDGMKFQLIKFVVQQ